MFTVINLHFQVKRAESFSEISIEDLYDSFVLSDKAKKFAIAREILLVNTYEVTIQTIISGGVAYLTALGIQNLSVYLEQVKPNVFSKSIGYFLVAAMGCLVWDKFRGVVRNYYELELQQCLSNLGEEYVQGGLELYSKDLERKLHHMDLKDQKLSNFNIISNIIQSIISHNDVPLQIKIELYKSKLEKAVTNGKTVENN